MQEDLFIHLEKWQAVRLKSLIQLGFDTLQQQGRTQFGIDGFTTHDLNTFRKILRQTEDVPKYAGIKNSTNY